MILFADKRQIINFSLIHFMCDIRFKTNEQILNCDWILPELYSFISFQPILTTLSVQHGKLFCVWDEKINQTHPNQVPQSIDSIQNHCLSSRQSLQQYNKQISSRSYTNVKIDDVDDDICDQVSESVRKRSNEADYNNII